jgi:hypothetical protein
MDRTELPLEPRHRGVPSSASKTISTPMVYSVLTMHLYCTDTNIVSKWTKTRFRMTPVTYEFHQVRPKLFVMYWYVQCKPCTYLASRFALYPNRPKRAPPDPRHLGVRSGASKTTYEPMVHLTQTEHLSCMMLTLSQNRSKRDSTWLTSPQSSIGCLQYYFWAYGTFDANHAPIL